MRVRWTYEGPVDEDKEKRLTIAGGVWTLPLVEDLRFEGFWIDVVKLEDPPFEKDDIIKFLEGPGPFYMRSGERWYDVRSGDDWASLSDQEVREALFTGTAKRMVVEGE